MTRKRIRMRGLYAVLTLLGIEALGKDAAPAAIRDLHVKHLTSPVHPKAIYPTLAALLEKHYVVRYRTNYLYDLLGYEIKTWRYAVTAAGQAFIQDFSEEVDTMRKLASSFSAKARRRA